MRPFWSLWLGVVGCLILLVGCGEEQPLTESSLQPTAETTLQPTPTLASNLPTPTPNGPQSEDGSTAVTAVSTPISLPTVTPLPSPTASPAPAMRLTLAETQLHNGDFAAAAVNLEAARQIQENYTASQQIYILYQLGVAYHGDGRTSDAVQAFNELLVQFPDAAPADVHLRLGQLYAALGDRPNAIAAYQFYLAQNPEMAAYVEPMLAEIYRANGEVSSVVAAYEAALEAPSQRLQEIANRQALAQLYLENGRLQEAIAQYDAIRNLARTEFTQGQMNYLAGMALLAAEDTEGAYGRFRIGITQYPRAYESYLGLVQLVDAGVVVDEYQRGLVNFHADSYQPAIAAFQRAIALRPDDYPAEAHLYTAWSYEAMGNAAEAVAAVQQYAALEPAAGLFEEANLRSRLGETAVALQLYRDYLAQFPDGPDAPLAAWRAASSAEDLGDMPTAVSLYTLLGGRYPTADNAAEGLFLAGWLAHEVGDVPTAVARWHQLIQAYPQTEYGGAGMVWLQRVLPRYSPEVTVTPAASATPSAEATASETPAPEATAVPQLSPEQVAADIEQLLNANRRLDYYWLRAEEIASGAEPFEEDGRFFPPTPLEQEALQQEAEAWLGQWLALPEGAPISQLSPSLASDSRLIVGQKLWEAGLYEAAKGEFENLRASVADDALLSYQLALYFRDIGLYRSSIMAAATVLNLSGQTVFEAPLFIGQLAYPVYYADLILPLAQRYSFDPRLQFSLVRQESLFESFARSGAAAQGLSQVIPDTGAYIANLLRWPDFVNEDLYKPYVGLNFGAFYLSQQINAFDGHVHAALAAYNGGPGNAARWYNQAGGDLDLFVEAVNFPETRLYIERIFVGFVIYEYLYGG